MGAARAQQRQDSEEMTSGTEVRQVLKMVLPEGLQFLEKAEEGKVRPGRNAVGGVCLYNRLPHRE